ncbi:MarR family winged helix-turn-helix transcriptional regulator [Rhizobium sp. L1K21]|uniref:MarR family winged helix-turn-helix transcriptional regulator n=1 Tax=Rhizobium sp. L1K21 TaxID=2954933 RepID=UPI002093E685|nr:MarR family transcriptional regulator [Rhizobium sp. L1K21]MCO6188553.1 MarR family transcriptional regulator [Rhizobium sp. L1K21]
MSSGMERILEEETAEATLLDAGAQENSVGYKLRLAQIMAYQAFEAQVAGFGSAPRYLGLLCVIQANPGQPQSRLAEAVALQRSSLVPILDRLEREGVLERRATENDRRSNTVWLTEHGQQILRGLLEEAERHEETLSQDMSTEERDELLRSLDKIIIGLRAGNPARKR